MAVERDAIRMEVERAMRGRHPEHAEEYLEYFASALAGKAIDFADDVAAVLSGAVRDAFPDRADELTGWVWMFFHHPTFDRDVPGVDPRAIRFFAELFEAKGLALTPGQVVQVGILSSIADGSWVNFVQALVSGLHIRPVEQGLFLVDEEGVEILDAEDPDLAATFEHFKRLASADRIRVLRWVQVRWGLA